jgi:aminocarboxymuconate-semialdehyde decarboxylase
MPLYEMMSGFDLPIWIHPTRESTTPDYLSEETSKYRMYASIGWPYETTAAMVRLVFSGIFDKYPNVKFITHHCGAMVPFLSTRLSTKRGGRGEGEQLKKPVEAYFKMFYGDTALRGNVAALMCGYAFFGEEHVIFGTDAPFGEEEVYAKNISAIEAMSIPHASKKKIFSENASRLLNIPT